MSTCIPIKLPLLVFVIIFVGEISSASVANSSVQIQNATKSDNCTRTSYDSKEEVEGRKKKGQEQDLMSRILPMMVIPFMVSTGMIPMMLVSLKLMLLKSMFVGKIAILLMLINMFRRRTDGDGGVFQHTSNSRISDEMSMQHYGYGGNEEYGAYVNKRRRRRRKRK